VLARVVREYSSIRSRTSRTPTSLPSPPRPYRARERKPADWTFLGSEGQPRRTAGSSLGRLPHTAGSAMTSRFRAISYGHVSLTLGD
jgi:hypothetical protein